MTTNATSSTTTSPSGPSAPSRRRWLELMLGSSMVASFVAAFYPVLKFVLPPPTGELDTHTVVAGLSDELAPNSSKIFRFGSKPGILVRLPDGGYKAFSAICTHLNCTVQYRDREHDIWCACHNGVYDLNGRNIGGPPPRPLEEYDVHERGEEIVAARREES